VYKLIFRGDLVAGAERAQTIANLSRLLKQSPERIEQLLFSGSARVVKRVDTADLAAKWQNAFAKAGAQLVIEAEPATQQEAIAPREPNNAAKQEAVLPANEMAGVVVQPAVLPVDEKNSAATIQRGKKIVLSAALLLVLVVAGIGLLWQQGYVNRWLLSSVSDEEKTLLNALADSNLLAIARMDFALLRRLDASAASSAALQENLPGLEADFWSSLERAGVNLPQQATHIYALAYVDKEVDAALVIRGNLTPKKIKGWIASRYGIDKEDEQGIWFSRIDPSNCEKGAPLLANIQPGQVILGAPAAVMRIVGRVKGNAPANLDTNDWQETLAGKLFSLAIFSPARWQGDKQGMVQHALAKAAAVMQPVREVYLDAAPDLATQGIKISLSIHSEDTKFISDSHALAKNWLDETRKEIAQDFPDVIATYNRLSLHHSSNQLQASLRFDRQIKDELANWFASLFRFSSDQGTANLVQQEVVNENPPVFTAANIAQLRSFSAQDEFMDAVYKTVAGPFGVGVESLALKDGKVEMKLGVKAYDLPGLGEEAVPAELVITDVTDAQGNSLLPRHSCGETDVRAATAIDHTYPSSRFEDGKLVSGQVLSGEKTLSLPAGVGFAQVAQIKGYIDYRLPTAVEKKIIEAPLAGKLVDLHGLRVRFKSAAASSLDFEYSGDTNRLLQVNALNAKRQVLATSGAMRRGMFFGSGKAASVEIKGSVAAAEIMVASAFENQRYEFVLTHMAPPAKAFFSEREIPPRFDDKAFEQLVLAKAPVINEFPFYPPKARVTAAPVELAINDVRSSSFGLSIEGAAYTDLALPLYAHIGVAQLFIQQVADAEGKLFPVNKTVPLYFERQGGMTFNGVYQPDEKTPWLRADFSFRAADVQVEKISKLQGELRFYQPRHLQTASLPFALGPIWGGPKSRVELVEWKAGRLVFNVQGNYEEIVGLKAFNAAGDLVSHPAQYSAIFGQPQLNLEISEVPTRFEIEYTSESEELLVPFAVDLPAGN
jgi:hypothetical protein